MAHVGVGVGEVVGGGEGEGGGAPHGADGQKFYQEGLAEVLINLGDDWEQEFCSRVLGVWGVLSAQTVTYPSELLVLEFLDMSFYQKMG